MLQAGHAALGLPAIRVRSLARHRAQDGHCAASLEVQRTMPQGVEPQAGQLGNKFQQGLDEACSEQVPTVLEGEKL